MSSAARDAIALLIEMAERGEIDPWDVQVITVIDRFLSELQAREDDLPLVTAFSRSRYEADLSNSGEAFLYASMLVYFKADSLTRTAIPEPEPLEGLEEFVDSFEDLATSPGSSLPRNLELQLRRRAAALPPRQRKVTLTELIEQLEKMAVALESDGNRSRVRQPKPQPRRQAAKAIAQLAHQENLAETAAALGDFLRENWLRIARGAEWLDFEELVRTWGDSQPQQGLDGDRVGVFWALLFLCAQSQVELQQDELFGPLAIRCLAVGSETWQPSLELATV